MTPEFDVTPREGDRRGWAVAATYAAGLVAAAALVAGSRLVVGDALYGATLPWLLVGTPPVVAALATLRGGGLAASLVIGLLPAVLFAAFVFFAPADDPLVGSALVAGVCLAGSVTGFAVGYAARDLLRLFQG
ncbi:hypothetical protein [Halomarina ordinaria]|uniref:Uncharacterized protein n=1 Tax=Halomarina ordinaria TaxID=3033939 RepID=A0ABD5UDX7_9EURY|nr:hypothetical protein [Halomarina sp. PSRA2]